MAPRREDSSSPHSGARRVALLRLLAVTCAVGALELGVPAPARSEELAADSKMRVGLTLVPMPFGRLTTGTVFPGVAVSGSADAEFAFGVLPYFDFAVTRYFFVGLAPQLTFGIKPQNVSGDAAREFDFLVRLGGNAPVADTIQLYGYIAPGYSVVMLPHLDDGTGLVLGFHGGAIFDLSSKLYLNGELGYQFGYQSTSILGQSVDTHTNYFHLGLGVGLRL